MINLEVLDRVNNISMLSFSSMQYPTFKEDKTKGWVEFGKKNDFPQQLLRLFEEHSEHAAIIGSKSNYLLGEGIAPQDKNNEQFLDAFLNRANPYESWNKVLERVKTDLELFNKVYIQVVTDLTGKPKDFYHLQYANIRTSKSKDCIWYSDNWLDRTFERKKIELFEPGKVGVYFISMEYYKPTKNILEAVYPMPQYIGCIKDISTDIDISTFNNNYVANGFSAGTLVTFFNGEPSPDEKRKIKESLINTHSSPEKAGSIVLNFAHKDGQAAQIQALNVDDLDKKFEFTSKRALEKILRGHNVTNPELFGVKTEGQLGTRVSLSESYELMLNTYTKPRQKVFLEWFEDIIFMTTGQYIELEIKQLKPIGLDLTNDQDLTQDERRIIKGYEPLIAPKLDANGQPLPVQASESNDALRGLTAKENQDLMRIVRDYTKGRLNEHLAKTRIKAYGLSDEDANNILEIQPALVQMAKQETLLEKFIKGAIDVDFEDEIIFEAEHIHNSNDALKHELKASKMFFEDALNISVTELKSAILNSLKGNPTQTAEALSKALKVDINKINEAITELIDKGLLEPNANAYEPTSKAYNKDTEPLERTEIYTVYKYAVKDGVPKAINGSREFCQRLMELSAAGKRWTFEYIDGLNNDMEDNTNAWDYRGGYYTNPNTGITDPFCRHIWKAETRIRKRKK